MRKHLMALSVATGLAATSLAAENRIDTVRPDAPELAAFGTFPIGVQSLDLSHADQLDVVNIVDGSRPTYDRPLTVEVWYPAADGTPAGGTYTTKIRDGHTDTTLTGSAARDAAPASGARFPLIVISHGYPGNRMLMSHLGENLASKGYVTVSIDHTDSTYSTQGAFGSTLLNRPIDQRFVIDQMAALDGPLGDIIDTANTGVIGYSMGGYGALIFAGAGLSDAAMEWSWGTPAGILTPNKAGSDTHEALIDERVKAVIAFGPWGMNHGFWDAGGLSRVEKPVMIIAGGVDDVSSYPAMRQIYEGLSGTTRHLLTFEAANHNAGAPMPAPLESYAPSEHIDFIPFEHYADAVWDNVRMNNISQHFATAFMDLHLKSDAEKASFFDLIPHAADGVTAVDDSGQPTSDHTYWTGFAPRTAQGLTFETLTP